jgi:hypothetical protein
VHEIKSADDRDRQAERRSSLRLPVDFIFIFIFIIDPSDIQIRFPQSSHIHLDDEFLDHACLLIRVPFTQPQHTHHLTIPILINLDQRKILHQRSCNKSVLYEHIVYTKLASTPQFPCPLGGSRRFDSSSPPHV